MLFLSSQAYAQQNIGGVGLEVLGNVTGPSFIGRLTTGLGPISNLTATQATSILNPCTTTLQGLVPPPPNSSTQFLNGTCTWSTPSAGSLVIGSTPITGATANDLLYNTSGNLLGDTGILFSNVDLLNTNQTISGIKTFSSNPVISAITNGGATLNLPTTSDTLVGRSTTDTLTNKTLTSPTINGAALSGTFTGNWTPSGVITLGAGTVSGTCSNNLAVNSGGNIILNSCPVAYNGGVTAGGTGTPNAYTIATPTPSGWSLTDQNSVRARINVTNTANATLAVNGGAATAIQLQTGSGTLFALTGGELVANSEHVFIYNSNCSCFVTGLTNNVTGSATSTTVTTTQWMNHQVFSVISASQTLTLPSSSTLGALGYIIVTTGGSSLTVALQNGADAINGGTAGASVTVQPNTTSVISLLAAGDFAVPVGNTGGGGTTFTVAAGLGSSNSIYNPGTQTITNGSTLYPQLFYKAITASCSVNNTCASTNDSGYVLTATAASVTMTLPATATGIGPFQFGYDTTHSYTLTVSGGTETIYGCGTTGNSVTLSNPAQLINDGTNYLCIPNGSSGGGGSVSSVGMTVPSWLSVTPSTITSSGVFAVTGATGQTANEVLATPNGSSGAPSLRALVNTDEAPSTVTALTDASNLTVPAAVGIGTDYTLSMSANSPYTLNNPASLTAGQLLNFIFTEDGTGGRVVSTYGTQFAFPGGTPTFNTVANAINIISCKAKDSTHLLCFGGAASGSQLVGTATNNNASAGNVGEDVESTIASGSAVSLTTVTPANVTSISLTAGDWDVCGAVDYVAGASTVTTYLDAGINTTTATLPAAPYGYAQTNQSLALTGNILPSLTIPCVRESLSSTVTVYLVTQSSFTTSTLQAYGYIEARRRR